MKNRHNTEVSSWLFKLSIHWGDIRNKVKLRYKGATCVACYEMHVTWSFTEGESIDDHFSLNREEQSTPIWTPTAGLQEDNVHHYTVSIFLLNWENSDSRKTSPGSDLSDMANVHKSTSLSPKPCFKKIMMYSCLKSPSLPPFTLQHLLISRWNPCYLT